jgi:uncharacterized protein YndB with AHSA1/START domain
MMEKVYEIYIKTTPQRLWQAITDPEMRRKYQFGVGVESDWKPGSHYEARAPLAPDPIYVGEILEADPPRRLVHTLDARWNDAVKSVGPTRVTWEIEQVEDSCCLTVTHLLADDVNAELYGGWPMILSGLKTLLETGEALTTPGSLRFAPRDAWAKEAAGANG